MRNVGSGSALIQQDPLPLLSDVPDKVTPDTLPDLGRP